MPQGGGCWGRGVALGTLLPLMGQPNPAAGELGRGGSPVWWWVPQGAMVAAHVAHCASGTNNGNLQNCSPTSWNFKYVCLNITSENVQFSLLETPVATKEADYCTSEMLQ